MWAVPDWFDRGRKPQTDYADSIRQVIDPRRSLDLLEAQLNVDPQRIAHVGHDFEAMYGAVLSGIEPRRRWYVLMAGTTSFSAWYLLGAHPPGKEAYKAMMRPLDPIPYLTQSRAQFSLFSFRFTTHTCRLRLPAHLATLLWASVESSTTQPDHGRQKPEIVSDRLSWLQARILQPNPSRAHC